MYLIIIPNNQTPILKYMKVKKMVWKIFKTKDQKCYDDILTLTLNFSRLRYEEMAKRTPVVV